MCDDYINKAITDEPYDVNNQPKTIIPIYYIIFGGVGVGALVGFIVVLIMKSKLKSVRMQPLANSYVKSGSFNVTERSDLYLYRNISKTAKPKDNDSSSGGSSTHTSSSGTSHGGSSGSF